MYSQSVLKAPAVFVITEVADSECKLVEKISPVHSVYFDSVEASVLSHLSCLDHICDLGLDLFNCDLLAYLAWISVSWDRRRCLLTRLLSAVAKTDLHEYLGSVCMDPLYKTACGFSPYHRCV